MAALTLDQVTEQLIAILHEAFEGPPNPWSYFTDHGPEAALFGTLARLSAAAASRPVAGASVAAHVHHLVFALAASAAWIRGDRSPHDWAQSWRVRTVDEPAWQQLQEQLREGYAVLRQAFQNHAADGAEAFGGAAGALAHVAYHLGAVRQKMALLHP
jgi:hypothetical protein